MTKLSLLIALLFLPVSARAKINIVTTIPDLAAITREIAGDSADVRSIARGDQDPHYLEPKPSYALTLNRADLLIEVGLDLEVGWLPVLVTQSRNPKIQTGQPGRLVAAEGFPILEIPAGPVDRSQGDVHPGGNPHYWLNPKNALAISKNIADRLTRLDASNAAAYETNLKAFQDKLRQKITEWEKAAASLRGQNVVTYHKSFSYFSDWLGLNIVDQIESKPGIPPSPGHILSLIERMKDQKTRLIITENYYESTSSRELSEKTGVTLLLLPTSVGGEPAIRTYFDLFDFLIGKLGRSS